MVEELDDESAAYVAWLTPVEGAGSAPSLGGCMT